MLNSKARFSPMLTSYKSVDAAANNADIGGNGMGLNNNPSTQIMQDGIVSRTYTDAEDNELRPCTIELGHKFPASKRVENVVTRNLRKKLRSQTIDHSSVYCESGVRSKLETTRKISSQYGSSQVESEITSKSKIREFTEVTTLHGIDQLFANTDRRSRLFWITIMCFVLDGLRFPSFSICILSKLNVTAAKQKYPEVNKTLLEFATTSFTAASSTALHDTSYFGQMVGIDPRDPRAKELLNQHHIELYKILQEKWGAENNIVDFADETTFSCGAQFSMCWMENGAIFRCCKGMVQGKRILTVTPYLVHHGACYEFVPNGYRQRIPGPVGGIGFVYLYPSEHLLHSAFNSYSGYAVHLYSSPADAMLERNPTILPIGYHSHVRLRAKHSKRIEIDILRNDKCQDPKLKYFKEYSYSNCQAECLIDANLATCNCSGVATVGSIPQEFTCNPLMAMNCYMNHVLAKQIGVLAQCFISKCREPCEYWSYDPTLTVSRAFNPNLEQLQLDYWNLPPAVNNKSTIDALIIGEIYFGDIQYTSIQEKEAVSLEGFVSNLGGAIGLWTGASIISLIHLLYFFVLRKQFSGQRGKTIEIATLHRKNQL